MHRIRTRVMKRSRRVAAMLTTLWVMGVAGCSASDLVGDPSGRTGSPNSPDAVSTPQGALEFYHGVLSAQATTLTEVITTSGLLTDELQPLSNYLLPVDSRHLPEGDATSDAAVEEDVLFKALQGIRGRARLGRSVLAQYLPDASPDLTGHLYAIEAMSDVHLAELFCSGIPLSIIHYDGSVTLRAGSTSADVYHTAVALFDSAIALTNDSTNWRNFAKVGKGRALLDLGDYQGAAQAVADVPLDFRYLIEYNTRTTNAFQRLDSTYHAENHRTIAHEGGNGLPFGEDGDWRTVSGDTTLNAPTPNSVGAGREPHKYDWTGTTPIILASGVEARLIAAEADLHANGSAWRTRLNELRATCTPGSDCASDLVAFDPPVTPLPDIVDPGSVATRVDTLFHERAAWLYLTGHREGDLRRLIRQYGRDKETLYPKGPYTLRQASSSLPFTTYGGDINLPVPSTERTNNSKFTGCLDRGA